MENDLSPFDWAFEPDKWSLFKVVLVLRAKNPTEMHKNIIQSVCNRHVQVSDVSVVPIKEEANADRT